MSKARIALLSNPRSTGNLSQLPRIRAFCAEHPDIFHYEVEKADQIGAALRTIARVRPKVLAINGGDGTVQAALTELVNGNHFEGERPPLAVLPNGKTNLIALDLGAQGDPVEALKRLLELAEGDLTDHIVARQLIALSSDGAAKPVIGMFLGGAGLADTMLYCRDKIYPLGLPNGLSHVITAVAVMVRQFIGLRGKFLPPSPAPIEITVRRHGTLSGRFALLAVTTLEKLLLGSDLRTAGKGPLKLVAVEHRSSSMVRGLVAGIAGRLGRNKVDGVHVEEADEISIEGDRSSVFLDGERFEAGIGKPITLTPASPLSFVRLAA
ncbi:diacylglycerol kinase family protein [Sphingomonas sp. LHG3406-1]|uniref:diacylglycerol/lipid kinase family protein n=1 Tax=Sphingomonas sp. LHG3406-1 TaxID=2804617 RepID=UPI0026372CB5|nr:acylglycerol kinase family protein [Sphingomonas sp. LHG3406-1]